MADPSQLTDEQLLADVSTFGRRLFEVGRPDAAPEEPTQQNHWGHPIPIRWELQLRTLWHAAWDSFDVLIGVLSVRASPSVLAQVRFLAEVDGLVRWLVGDVEHREARAYALARQEIRDMRQGFGHWERPEKPDALAWTKVMERDLTERINAIGIRVPDRPGLNALARQFGRAAYALLSDMGSHVGLTGSMAFFTHPDTRTVNLDLGGSYLQRAFFLVMGAELGADIAVTVARARGWDDLRDAFFAIHHEAGPTFAEASNRAQRRATN